MCSSDLVDYGARVKRGDAGYMGHPAVILSVQKQPSGDTLKLTQEVEAALTDLRRVTPKGVTASVLFRQADFIKVSGAEIANGLLHVDLVREVPEAMKPRTIKIAGATAQPTSIAPQEQSQAA